ncbi:MAG: dockerin type I domain-containing protein, partial [Planctomycetota bacterium]
GSLGYVGIPGATAAFEINVYSGHTQGTNLANTNSSGTSNSTCTVNVASGDPIQVSVTYDAAALTVTVVLTDMTTGNTNTTTYSQVNFATLFGSEPIYAGFTGADGGTTSQQKISQFSFCVQPLVAQHVRLIAGTNIGSANAPLILQTASPVEALAANNISLAQPTGDLLIDRVISDGGTVSLTAGGSLVNASSAALNGSGGAVDGTSSASANIVGNTINLTALSGGIGSEEFPLLITAQGLFSATAVADIWVNTVPGDLSVGTVASTSGSVTLDPPEPRQSIILQTTSSIIAPRGQVTLQAHNDVLLPLGSVIHAVQVTVQGGHGAATNIGPSTNDPDSTITLAGLIDAAHLRVLGGNGNDTIHFGSDGSDFGSLDLFRGRIEYWGGGGSDRLLLDDRGARDVHGNPLTAGYALTANQVGNNPGADWLQRQFSGLWYDASVTRIELFGSATHDIFHVKPSAVTEFVVQGAPGANSELYLDTTATHGANQEPLAQQGQIVPGSGRWTFVSNHQDVLFGGIASSQPLTLSASGSAPLLLQAPAQDATVTIQLQGFTALDLPSLQSEPAAIRVSGPLGYQSIAQLVSIVPTRDGVTQIATYRVAAPGGTWDRSDNGRYEISVLPHSIVDSVGTELSTGAIGSFWTSVDGTQLTSTQTSSSQYRLEIDHALPGSLIVFAYGTKAGQYALDNQGLRLDTSDPVFLVTVPVPDSGHVQTLFTRPATLADQALIFQAYQRSVDPLETQPIVTGLSDTVSSATLPRLIHSITRAGGNVASSNSVEFTVTFSEPVQGVTLSDFALAMETGVTNAQLTALRGSGTTYTVTVATGQGDGKLALNLREETKIAAATGSDPSLTRQGLFVGEAYQVHKIDEDVNLDLFVTPLDALLLVNLLNQHGSFFTSNSPTARDPRDVNLDQFVTPLDALIILNRLNRSSSAGGEAEALSETTLSP